MNLKKMIERYICKECKFEMKIYTTVKEDWFLDCDECGKQRKIEKPVDVIVK